MTGRGHEHDSEELLVVDERQGDLLELLDSTHTEEEAPRCETE